MAYPAPSPDLLIDSTSSSMSARLLLAVLAATAPSLLAYNVSPSPTFLNQALGVALWGWFVLAAVPAAGHGSRGAGLLQAALALVGLGVLWSWLPGALPAGLALSALALLAAAATLVACGAGAHTAERPADVFVAFAFGWLAAGVCGTVIGGLQVFAPELAGNDWLAASTHPGRAVGNLRQPNHLSSLMMWSCVAVVALLDLRRLSLRVAAPLLAVFVFTVVLTASRTGLVSVLLLAAWGLADRKLSRPARGLLLAAPLLYAVSWLGMAEWAKLTQATFGGAARLAETDISSSRFGIWKNTLTLIAMHPWAGVGFGEFNFAWSLTAFPGRPVAFFDHTHNLPLQLAVELGLPLGGAVMVALLWALARAGRRAWAAGGEAGTARRAALAMVVMIGVHSLLEYPLWYSYFLLPAAWAFAFALGRGTPAAQPVPASRWVAGAGVALVAGSVVAVLDFTTVTPIFSAADGGGTLEQRVARGQRSVLFAHHADYAAATTDVGGGRLQPFERATHYLLDTRLMMSWAKALAAHGEVDEARWIAARLREFRNPASEAFFAACQEPGALALQFQCQAPERVHDWREFIRP